MFSAQLAHVPSGTSVSWSGCINSDEGDNDYCGDPANEGMAEGDGPGTISPSSGLTVTYTAPRVIYFGFVRDNGCSPPDTVNRTYAYVALTATMTVNGQQYPSTVCIKVTQ
jgi:hypothetical protein